MSHIRSEDIRMPDAIDEIIEIGRVTKMPVQISHIKLGKKDDWGTAQLLINKLEKARAAGINITADVYPYTYWNSTLRVLFPTRDYTNPVSAEFAVNQIIDVNESYLVKYAPVEAYRGKTIAAIAAMRNEKPSTTLMALIAIASDFKEKNPEFKGTIDAIAGKSMIESDVAAFIAWPNANICSDGNNTGGHPRGQGAFARVLGKYVREDKVIPLETAIYKMTGLTAQHLGMKNRGVIAVGNYADLVLFNPATVKDNATIQNSRALSTGIEMVWINGEVTYKNQKTTGAYPGVFLKR
jgi:N-acyl-D-aspartate/D-glutamate deacylase